MQSSEQLANNLKRGTIGIASVGFDMTEIGRCFYGAGLLNGILDRAKTDGCNVQLLIDFAERTRESVDSPPPCNVDGVLVIAPDLRSKTIEAFRKMDIPVVAIGTDAVNSGVPSVDVDNAHGASMAVEHLIGLGHRRIAHIMGTVQQTSAIERRDAFRHVMESHGLPVPDDNIQQAAYHGDGIREAVLRILNLKVRPTAIFAANDHIALSTVRAANDIGLPIPERLSIIGFDDIEAGTLSSPQLTTIRQPLDKLGALATDLLLRWISGHRPSVKTYLLHTEIIVRGSTAPV